MPRDGAPRAPLSWASRRARRSKIGSDAHKELFCRHFNDTYQDYEPATPALARARRGRRCSGCAAVPFWQEVLHTERRAGAIVAAFAATIDDPVLSEAVALQGFEEARHAELLRVMIRRYGIDATEQPLDAAARRYRDRLQGFRLRRMRRFASSASASSRSRAQSGFLPESMFDDLRHADVRGDAAHRLLRQLDGVAPGAAAAGARAGGAAPPRCASTAARCSASSAPPGAAPQVNDGKDFSATQASIFLDGFTFRRFLEDCYAENARRMSAFDRTLLRPRLLPAIAGASLRALKLWHREHGSA